MSPEEKRAPVCPNCGQEVEPGTVFCGSCGQRIEAAPPPPPTPTPPPPVTPPGVPTPPPARARPSCLPLFLLLGLLLVCCLGGTLIGAYDYFSAGKPISSRLAKLIGRATPTHVPTIVIPTPMASPTPTTPVATATPTLTAEEYITQGDDLFFQSKLEEAIEQYKKATEVDPQKAVAYARWARALNCQAYLQHRGDIADEALAKAIMATQVDPTSAEAFARLTRAYDWDGQYDKAVAAGQKAIELDPNYAEAHALLAEAYLDTDNMIQAEVEAQKALELDPDNAEAHRSMGFVYWLGEQKEAAAAEFETAMKSEPNLALRHCELAAQYRGLERYDLATTGYERAIALYPQSAIAYYGLGRLHHGQERYAEAIPYYQQAIAINDEYMDSHWRLGQCYSALEQYQQAITTYQRVIELEPEADNAYANMGWAYYELGDYSAATTAAQKALQLNPENETAQGVLAALGVVGFTPLPITPSPGATAPPTLTGTIAFAIFNSGAPETKPYDLYARKADGSGPRSGLADKASQPAYSPDGSKLAIHSTKEFQEGIVIMNATGGNRQLITHHKEDSYPCWSADGRSLVFSSTRHGDRKSRLYRVKADGSWEDVMHYSTGGEMFGEHPTWLSDGRIVYKGCDLQGNCGLMVISGEGGTPQRITTDPGDTAPASYGSKIAFMSHRDGNWEVYLVNADGSGLKRLTDNPANDGLPTWSPDGRLIAFVSDRDGAWGVWVMNADGGDQRKLFALEGEYSPRAGQQWTTERIDWAP